MLCCAAALLLLSKICVLFKAAEFEAQAMLAQTSDEMLIAKATVG